MKSKYRFTKMPYAFRIAAPGHDRQPVVVKLGPGRMAIHVNDVPFHLVDWYGMAREVTDTLMDGWRADPCGQVPSFKMERWAKNQCGRAIGKRLREHWERLRQLARPQALEVQKAMLHANWPQFWSSWPYREEFYKHKYMVKDVINYRAAAIALEFVGRRLEHMHDWMRMYGTPNGSLRRTLMNLPGGLPATLYKQLGNVELERPVTDRLELATLLIYTDITHYYDGANEHLVMHARHDDIKRAMALFSERRGCNYSTRKTLDIRQWVRYIADYPDTHDGNIVGLTQRALDWHAQDRAEQARMEISSMGPVTIEEPPALPDIPGIEFLDTSEKIIQEGSEMGHCVASYVRRAAKGYCYLFHAEKGGTHATVELGPDLRVMQSQGPHNHSTVASEWARKVLNEWGKSARDKLDLPEPEERILW